MGFKELLKAKSLREYSDAKKDPQKMEEIKNRTNTDIIKNVGESVSSSSEFGFKLSKDSIKKGTEIKSLNNVIARIETGSELQTRVTMTRLLALGVFAFAAKKKKAVKSTLLLKDLILFGLLKLNETEKM